MVVQYESFRSLTPNNIFSVSISANPNQVILTGTYYFWAAFRNRVGFNLPSDSKTIILNNGDRASISINANIIESGEGVYQVVLLCSTTDDINSARQITAIDLRQFDRTTLIPLPITLHLDRAEHLNLSHQIATTNDLPVDANRLNGQVREITTTGKILEYHALENAWKERSRLSSVVTDTTAIMGCDRPVELVDPRDVLGVPQKNYNIDVSPLRLWWSNGLVDDGGVEIPQDSKAQIAFWLNGSQEETNLFVDRVKVRLLGYVDRATGIFTPIPSQQYFWHPKKPLNLPQSLPRGHAAVWELILSFDNAEINLPHESNILVSLTPIADIGIPSDLWALTGDCAIDSGNKLLILPNRRLSGKALVKGYSIEATTEQYLINTNADTDNILAAISGSRNGEITLKTNSNQLLATEAIRAKLSTLGGEQGLSTPTSPLTVAANGKITVTIAAANRIRSDYPDEAIRNKIAPLNAPQYNLYLIKDSNTYYKKIGTITALVSGTLTVSISDLSEFTQINNLPTALNDFGLFEYGNKNVTVGIGGNLPAGNYEVRIAYLYPNSGNHAVTKITHSPNLGCIPLINLFGGNNSQFIYDGDAIKDALSSLSIGNRYTTTYIDEENDRLFVSQAQKDAIGNIPDLEAIQDIVGALLQEGTNITVSYDDNNNVLILSSAGGTTTTITGQQIVGLLNPLSGNDKLSADALREGTTNLLLTPAERIAIGNIPNTETIQDIVGALIQQGSNVTVNYDDTNNLLTIVANSINGADYLDKANYTSNNFLKSRWFLAALPTQINQVGGSFYLQDADNGKLFYYASATAINLYLPSTSETANMQSGWWCEVSPHVASDISFQVPSGITAIFFNDLTHLKKKGCRAIVHYLGSNKFQVVGGLEA